MKKIGNRFLAVLFVAVLLVGCAAKKDSIETIKDVAKTTSDKMKAAEDAKNSSAQIPAPTIDPTITAAPVDPVVTAVPTDASNTELSDDLYSFEIMFDGIKYALPADYSSFAANGWIFEDADANELNPDSMTMELMNKGEQKCYFDFLNTDIDVVKYSACKISAIDVSSFQVENGESDVLVLPKGIHIGSTEEELKTAYGEPTASYTGDSVKSYTYEKDIYASIELSIDTKTNKVSGISIENCYLPEGESKAKVADDSIVPKENAKYVVPVDLGTDITKFNFELDGKNYTMPCPFSEFAADGWTIVPESNMTLSAKEFQVGIEIQKGDKLIRTMMKNYGSVAATSKNCFVAALSVATEDKINVILPGNITFGTPEADVQKIYDSVTSEKETEKYDSKTYQSVHFTFGDYSDNVTVTCVNGVVDEIEVDRAPSDIPY